MSIQDEDFESEDVQMPIDNYSFIHRLLHPLLEHEGCILVWYYGDNRGGAWQLRWCPVCGKTWATRQQITEE